MSTGTLDTASLDSATDAQLNELFAVEVAGWSILKHRGGILLPGYYTWRKPDGADYKGQAPLFTTDANAVLPWLEKDGEEWTIAYEKGRWVLAVCKPKGDMYAHLTYAPTFPRAAVIALIREKRAAR